MLFVNKWIDSPQLSILKIDRISDCSLDLCSFSSSCNLLIISVTRFNIHTIWNKLAIEVNDEKVFPYSLWMRFIYIIVLKYLSYIINIHRHSCFIKINELIQFKAFYWLDEPLSIKALPTAICQCEIVNDNNYVV